MSETIIYLLRGWGVVGAEGVGINGGGLWKQVDGDGRGGGGELPVEQGKKNTNNP